jgi:hypothetical protein
MRIILKCTSAASLLSLAGTANAVAPPPRPEKHACHDDAFRFCARDIPNRAKIHAYLVRNVENVSPGCRAIISPR